MGLPDASTSAGFGCGRLAADQLAAQEPVPVDSIRYARSRSRRILTEVRVVDRSGEPVQGLTVDDFHVTIDGQPVTVESVAWVPTSGEAPEQLPGCADDGWRPRQRPSRRRTASDRRRLSDPTSISTVSRAWCGWPPKPPHSFATSAPVDRVALFAFESHLETAVGLHRRPRGGRRHAQHQGDPERQNDPHHRPPRRRSPRPSIPKRPARRRP